MGTEMSSDAHRRAVRKYTARRIRERVGAGTCRLCQRPPWVYNGHTYAHCEYHHSLILWHNDKRRCNNPGPKPVPAQFDQPAA